jgi:Mrp family chromosome partitioning ATPase
MEPNSEVQVRRLDPRTSGSKDEHAPVGLVRSVTGGNGNDRMGFRRTDPRGGRCGARLPDAERATTSPVLDNELRRIVEQINIKLPDSQGRVILVTGAEASDTISNVTWWLAVALANGGLGHILYLNAAGDQSRGALDPGLEVPPGLLDLIQRPDWLEAACTKTSITNLRTMQMSGGATGAIPVGDEQIRDVLTELRQRFGYILIAAQPPMSSPMTLLFARHSGGVLLVIDANRTDRERVVVTADLLRQGGGQIIGAILNKAGTP